MHKQNFYYPYDGVYSERNVVTLTTTWMNLDNIMLICVCVCVYFMIPFTQNFEKSQIHKDRM